MRQALFAISCRSFIAMVFGAVVLAACQSTGFSTNPSALGVLRGVPRPAGRAVTPLGTPPPIGFSTWLTENDPSAPTGANNKITGIDDNLYFVGVYFTGTASETSPTSFGASPDPSGYGFKTFTPPPHTSTVYLTGRVPSGKGGEVGFATGSGSFCSNICGAIHMAGWTLVSTGSCNQTKLLGVGAERISVGEYVSGAGCGKKTAVEEYQISTCCGTQIGSPQFVAFAPPGTYSRAVATGMNGNGDAVGYTIDGSGNSTGWFYSFDKYYTITISGATSTQPLGLNWQDNIVGTYTDATGTGTGTVTYGFLAQHPKVTPLDYQNIYFNVKTKYTTTVPASIDDCNDIAGWYSNGSDATLNGFVATTTTAGKCSIGSAKVRTLSSKAKRSSR